MIKCLNKKTENAKKYFTFENKNYQVCCNGCVKTIIKKLIKKKEVKEVKELNEKDIKSLEKISKTKIDDILKQALMEMPKKRNKRSHKLKRPNK